MQEETKKINIIGTNNRYKIKQLNQPIENKIKKRVESEKWTFSEEHYKYENQIIMINDISNNIINEISKIAIQQINKKIYSYKQQDIIKKLLNEEKFLTFESIINKMNECKLKCRYCKKEMNVLYDISREMTQWSVDRIDNDKGHNMTKSKFNELSTYLMTKEHLSSPTLTLSLKRLLTAVLNPL